VESASLRPNQLASPREPAINKPTAHSAGLGTDLHGASKLVIDAVGGVTDIVEDMHRTILRVAPPVGAPRGGRTGGISGLVYRSVRGVTHAVGSGLDMALGRLAPLLDRQPLPVAARDATLAALNGVLGDYLQASGNPLALGMQWRHEGQALESDAVSATLAAQPGKRVLVLLHGLCMNDRQWLRDGHDHGAALAAELGVLPLYLRYNSGLAIAENGRQLADRLEALMRAPNGAPESLLLLGHSMGGLLARSALHHGHAAGHVWPRRVQALACLGTPHLGAPLERAGRRVDMLLGVSPYSAPFARLGLIRSAGIQGLRHGQVLAVEHDLQHSPPLPASLACFLIAASKGPRDAKSGARPAGDGLVPVDSALGRHADPTRTLVVPEAHRAIVHGHDHFDLLGSREVYQRLLEWLRPR
jgi:hypothetical protein